MKTILKKRQGLNSEGQPTWLTPGAFWLIEEARFGGTWMPRGSAKTRGDAMLAMRTLQRQYDPDRDTSWRVVRVHGLHEATR